MNRPDIEGIAARAERATAGPWYWNSYSQIQAPCGSASSLNIAAEDEPGIARIATLHHTGNGDEMPDKEARRNALFIQHSRADVPALCAYVRHLEAIIASLQDGDGGGQ